VTVRVYWLTGFSITMVAPGMTAPDGSVTVPDIEDEPAVCAVANRGENASTKLKQNHARNKGRNAVDCFFFADWEHKCELLGIPSSNFS
jgi:hypothetical protein